MLITAIERRPKTRTTMDVYVDGAASFEVARVTVRAQGLRPGRLIEQAEVDAIVAGDRRRSALRIALAMLARRQRSEFEVRRRLVQRRFEQDVVHDTLARLVELRLLDDAAFARSRTEARDQSSPRSRRLMLRELRACGIAPDIAADATELIDDEAAAWRVASRRMHVLESQPYDVFRTRLASCLRNRGFGWDVISITVERCWLDLGRQSDAEGDAEEQRADPKRAKGIR